jgi:hypothetical protein
MSDAPFSSEQQEYLKGFMSGVEARRSALGLPATPAGEGEAQAKDRIVSSSRLGRYQRDAY